MDKQKQPTTITKTFNKSELINDLKAIPTKLVNIRMTANTNEVLIMQPYSGKFVCHISK